MSVSAVETRPERCNEAVRIEDRADVVAWMKRLQKLAKDMPSDVRVYIGNGGIFVMSGRVMLESEQRLLAALQQRDWGAW